VKFAKISEIKGVKTSLNRFIVK